MDRAELLTPTPQGTFSPHVSSDFIDKLQNGDPTIGWEGDPNLWVESVDNTGVRYFELWGWKLDGSGKYRVCESDPDTPFDERLLVKLCEIDGKRNPNRDIHAEVVAHNDKLDADQQATQDEWVAEEIAPRLRRALQKDGY